MGTACSFLVLAVAVTLAKVNVTLGKVRQAIKNRLRWRLCVGCR